MSELHNASVSSGESSAPRRANSEIPDTELQDRVSSGGSSALGQATTKSSPSPQNRANTQLQDLSVSSGGSTAPTS